MVARLQRWAIYIDIEGTSKIYPHNHVQFFRAVDALFDAVCRIGSRVCPEEPDRLFVHQTGGDGLIIVSELSRRSPELPIAIAIILMRTVLAAGSVAKAGISHGEFGDVQSCFPSLRSYPSDEQGRRRLGRGIFATLPVMGTALVNAHRVAKGPPRGARLAVDRTMIHDIPPGVFVSNEGIDAVVVDWVHAAMPTIDEVMAKAGISLPTPSDLRQRLLAYVANAAETPDEAWKHSTLSLNRCSSYA